MLSVRQQPCTCGLATWPPTAMPWPVWGSGTWPQLWRRQCPWTSGRPWCSGERQLQTRLGRQVGLLLLLMRHGGCRPARSWTLFSFEWRGKAGSRQDSAGSACKLFQPVFLVLSASSSAPTVSLHVRTANCTSHWLLLQQLPLRVHAGPPSKALHVQETADIVMLSSDL